MHMVRSNVHLSLSSCSGCICHFVALSHYMFVLGSTATMSDTAKQSSHGLKKPMLGYFTPKTLEDSSTIRKHLVAAAGELIGTFFFLFGKYNHPDSATIQHR
jgi:hypothetical protein